ncbi:DUF6141 family protein [Acidobacteriota bacterium]
MEEHSGTLFHETQRFNQWWIWLIVLLTAGIAWYGAYVQLLLKTPFGNNPAPDTLMWILWIVVGVLFPFAFKSMRLETRVRCDGLHVKFTIFQRKGTFLGYKDIQKFEIRTYKAYREFGGYGIRYGFSGKGRAYNVSGNKGIQLTLTDDKKFLIGTQKPEQFFSALDSALRSFRG